MFSEHLIDDAEKIKERSAKAFFLYPARKKKDGTEPSFEEKWKRGAPKARKWADKSEYLSAMRNKMLTAVAEVNKWKRVIISQHDAEEKAKLEYMTKSERELWLKFFETLGRKKQLEEFLTTLKKPDKSKRG